MSFVSRDGSSWMPSYLTAINAATCIGCGRCYKVCSRDVMHLHGVDEDGRILGKIEEGSDEDFDGELNRSIMVLDNAGACIGCGSCARVCPKACQTHTPADRLAA